MVCCAKDKADKVWSAAWIEAVLAVLAFACSSNGDRQENKEMLDADTAPPYTTDSGAIDRIGPSLDGDVDADEPSVSPEAEQDAEVDRDSRSISQSDTGVSAFSCDSPNPNWLLCEDFEAGNGDFDDWFQESDFIQGSGTDDRGRVTLSSEQSRSGNWALYMPAAPESGYQGGSLDWRACEGEQATNCSMRSFYQLYFRVWVRFADDHSYVHHFLNVGGSQPDDFWYHGTAGCLPDGELHMGTTVDFREESHESHFYTYFPEMSCDTNCERYADVSSICSECAEKGLPTCESQPQCCWGNHFEPDPPVDFPVGHWFCFEMMMRANTPGEHDGSMAYWLDDTLVHREDGMMWRTSPTLALNRVRVQHYITTDDAEGHSNRVWFEDVVVSTERIGCDLP